MVPPVVEDFLESRIPRHPYDRVSIVRRDDRDCPQTQHEIDLRACQSFRKRIQGFLPIKDEII